MVTLGVEGVARESQDLACPGQSITRLTCAGGFMLRAIRGLGAKKYARHCQTSDDVS